MTVRKIITSFNTAAHRLASVDILWGKRNEFLHPTLTAKLHKEGMTLGPVWTVGIITSSNNSLVTHIKII